MHLVEWLLEYTILSTILDSDPCVASSNAVNCSLVKSHNSTDVVVILGYPETYESVDIIQVVVQTEQLLLSFLVHDNSNAKNINNKYFMLNLFINKKFYCEINHSK